MYQRPPMSRQGTRPEDPVAVAPLLLAPARCHAAANAEGLVGSSLLVLSKVEHVVVAVTPAGKEPSSGEEPEKPPQIRPETATAATIYYTRRSLEFYMAEQMVYRRARENPGRPLTMSSEGPVSGQDVLILDPSIGIKELPQLAGYRLAGTYSGVFSLYTRKQGL